MNAAARAPRLLTVLLLAALVSLPGAFAGLVLGAGSAVAQEPPGAAKAPPPAAREAAKKDAKKDAKPAAGPSDTLTTDDLDERLLANAAARWSLLLTKLVPILIGIALLIAWFLKRDKIKGGQLPAPPPVETTVAFPIGGATLLAAVGLFIAPSVFVLLLAGGADVDKVPMGGRLAAMALPTLAVAVLFLLRRQRLHETPPPRLRRALGLGAWTYCVAGVAFVPVALGWGLLLKVLGFDPVTQAPVKEVVDATSDTVPILMVVFGTFVAPFTEECIFRGMLYPAVKRALGGGSRATWLGAVIVSAIFAGIHLNVYAFLPLFALALILNWVFAMTNSLAACVIAHALHNGLTMVPLLLLRYT